MSTLTEMLTEQAEDQRSTDKHIGHRAHAALYEQFFGEYRDSAKKLLEFGVCRGGSIKVWRKYFPNAKIYGADIQKSSLTYIKHLDNVIPVHLNQGKEEDLIELAKSGPFDIIIDDGSHEWAHQISTFEHLWPAVAPGGMFVIEDISTSYVEWQYQCQDPGRFGEHGEEITAVEYFKNLIDEVNATDWTKRSGWTPIQKTVDWMGFRPNSIFFKKRLTLSDSPGGASDRLNTPGGSW